MHKCSAVMFVINTVRQYGGFCTCKVFILSSCELLILISLIKVQRANYKKHHSIFSIRTVHFCVVCSICMLLTRILVMYFVNQRASWKRKEHMAANGENMCNARDNTAFFGRMMQRKCAIYSRIRWMSKYGWKRRWKWIVYVPCQFYTCMKHCDQPFARAYTRHEIAAMITVIYLNSIL